ncbi:hypothetical protein GHK92_07075 [Nocardioides sp. dk4132]|uniref:SCO7613 C-terminal domain-containing membrane protein n=1 Tax=unclassified Nocardioides TaxID=2615069 RepID=UPI001295CF34|nr:MULTISPECIES: hypothetical protein [unclassified Nocardioides]MQW75628.1 hypothetical protein [Nocardioides sp. dk4132]
MPRFYDPTTCPDCAAPLGPVPLRCGACALPLTGPVAAQLQATLRQADSLLVTLRRSPAPAPTPVAAGSRLEGATAYPAPAREPRTPRRTGVRAASVPAVLLSLGALCLLVAAVIFLAVAWSWLGVGGRTGVLLALTAGSAGAGAWTAHRGLRVAGESLSVVALGLLALDVLGAAAAGWLPGAPGASGAQTLATAGAALAAGGLVLLLPPARLVAPQLAVPVGILVCALGTAAATGSVRAVALGAVLLLLAVAAGARRVGAAPLTIAAALAAVPAWLALLGAGAARGLDDPTLGALWTSTTGPVLLLTAALPLLGIAAVPGHRSLAQLCAATSALTLTAVLALPVVDEPASTAGTAALGALLVWSGVLTRVPRRWAPAPLAAAVASALPVASVALTLLSAAAARSLAEVNLFGSPASAPMPPVSLPLAPALLVPAVAGLGLAALAAAPALRDRRALGPGPLALALAGAGTVALESTARWPVVVALLVPGLIAGALGVRRARTTWQVAGVTVLAAAALVGLPSAALAAGALLVLVALTGTITAQDRAPGAAVLPWAAGLLVLALGDLTGSPLHVVSLVVLLVLGLLALARPRLDLLVAAAALALPVASAGVLAAPDAAWSLAVHLSVAGALVTGVGLIHARRELSAVGGVLLAAATWVRLADAGVGTPEAYTLPSAVVLVLLGLRALHRDPSLPTARVLLPGLVLGTVPTLLIVLVGDPASVRAALLGLACLGLVLGGVRKRWHAPFAVGSGVGLLLVLRELAPYAAAPPQWVLIAAAGTVLSVVGITWEQRVADLRRVAEYAGRFR